VKRYKRKRYKPEEEERREKKTEIFFPFSFFFFSIQFRKKKNPQLQSKIVHLMFISGPSHVHLVSHIHNLGFTLGSFKKGKILEFLNPFQKKKSQSSFQ